MQKEAKLTSKGQITVPKAVRHALGVKPGDKLVFEQTGRVISVRKTASGSVFEKYRGIGNEGIKGGRESVIKAIRELRDDEST